MKTEINLKLSPETWKYIRDEASRRQNSAAEIIAEILSEVIEDNYREPSKAEILEGIRIGMQQALTGELAQLNPFLESSGAGSSRFAHLSHK